MATQAIASPPRRRGRPARDQHDASMAIRQAALTVFAQNGFDRASIAEIAKVANVAKPLIHYHFASKEVLWKSAVSYAQAALMAETLLFQERLSHLNPMQSIEFISEKMVEFAASHPQLVRIVVDETGKGGSRAEWLFEHFLLPSYAMGQTIIDRISKELKLGNAKPKAEHLLPVMLGVMNFPFLEAEIIRRAYGKDVYSKTYIKRHGKVMFNVLKTFFMPT
jgi:TetR/AcrR family transcriptional regulator